MKKHADNSKHLARIIRRAFTPRPTRSKFMAPALAQITHEAAAFRERAERDTSGRFSVNADGSVNDFLFDAGPDDDDAALEGGKQP